MPNPDYVRVEKAIRYLEENFRRQPTLEEVARATGLSEYHFQRLFRRWVGVSPKRFLQYLTAGHARDLLERQRTVLDAAYEVGLSGAGRLHDLMVGVDAVTPGEVRRLGAGLVVRYGLHDTPFGEGLIAVTERGICGMSFLEERGEDGALEELRARWPEATLVEDPAATGPLVGRIFEAGAPDTRLPLLLRGTNFQVKVWEALLRIPAGAVATYEEVAELAGAPGAARAVGTAVGRNPVAYLIPCHRVIRKSGVFGDYRWGATRKRAILGWEAARRGGAAREALAI